MKKILSFSLAALLMQTLFAHQIFAETKEEKFTGRVKTEIAKLGTGTDAKIKVKLKDGTKIKGYLIEAGENQFSIMNSKTGQAVPVGYSQVGQVKGNNLSSGTIVILGFAAFIVVLFVLAATQL